MEEGDQDEDYRLSFKEFSRLMADDFVPSNKRELELGVVWRETGLTVRTSLQFASWTTDITRMVQKPRWIATDGEKTSYRTRNNFTLEVKLLHLHQECSITQLNVLQDQFLFAVSAPAESGSARRTCAASTRTVSKPKKRRYFLMMTWITWSMIK